jgi:23S rRNA (cytidine1920-2'-O)/16S rRNA (cytidine1409-2'-O)-methyltransferase
MGSITLASFRRGSSATTSAPRREGFTDVLLTRGAAKVLRASTWGRALAWKLRQDARVVVLERTNARH